MLQSLEGQHDPTLKHAGQATAPDLVRRGPDVPKLTGLGAAIGAVLGALVALLILAFRRLGGRAAGGYDRAMPDDDALEQVVSRLEARLVARESALAAREHDLQEALAELKAAQAAAAEPPDDSDLVRRERQLEQRVAAVTKRELKLARRAAEVETRAKKLERRAAEPPPVPVEPDARSRSSRRPQPEPRRSRRRRPRLPPRPAERPLQPVTLEKLVEEKRHEFPDRADDWTSYLYFLREHAAADGTVPATFDWLIQDTFAELVS